MVIIKQLTIIAICVLASIGGVKSEAGAASTTMSALDQLNQQMLEYYRVGDYVKGISAAKKALSYAKEHLGAKHPDTLTSMNNLALFYQSLGHYDQAEPLSIEALALSQEVLGAKHPTTLTNMNNLASLYQSQGRYGQAEPLYIEALDISMEVLGPKHPNTLLSMNNLAILYRSQGRYDQAEPLSIEALALSQEVLGAKHPTTLVNMNNLASLYQSQGRYDQAEPLSIEALALSQEILGVKHPSTLTNMTNLAHLYQSQGRYDQAELLSIEALALRKEVLGGKHPDTLGSVNGLAAIYQSQGRYDQAEPLYIEALALRKEVLGAKHPSTLNSMNNLSRALQSQGRYDQAELLLIEALALRKEALGGKHPGTLDSMNSLAILYKFRGRFDQAEPLYIEALALRKEVLGAKHPGTLDSMNGLAILYQSQGRYDQAEPLSIEALALSQEVLGAKHPSTLKSMNNLAALYQSQGRYDQAELLLIESLALSREVLGAKHPSTLNRVNDLAALYQSQGRYDQAEPLFIETLDISIEVLGTKHPGTLTSMYNLASLYQSQGGYNQAEPLSIEALELRKKVLGAKHPDTLDSMSNLAALYYSQGRYGQVEVLSDEALAATQAFLTQVLWGAGEKTRGSYILQQKGATDFYLSLFSRRATDANARRALALSLNRKALLLQIASQIRAVSRSSDNPTLKELANALKDNRKKLSALVLAGNSDWVELQSLEERINQQQAELGHHVQQLQRSSLSVTPEQVVQVLDDQSVFIDFLVYPLYEDNHFQAEQLMALVVSNDPDHPVRILSLGELAPIRQAIEQYRTILRTPNRLRERDKAVGRQLYQSLWSPLVPYLKEKQQVYLAPDGILNLLPFTSLIDEAGRYIVSQYKVIMVSSGRDLVLPALEAEVTAPMILAAPLFDAAQAEDYAAGTNRGQATTTARSLEALHFSPLAGTLKEGDDLAAQLAQSHQTANYYKLAEATESVVKEVQSPRILHLATHGFFLEDVISKTSGRGLQQPDSAVATDESPSPPPVTGNPLLRAGMALADANVAINSSDDNVAGILTAEEVLDLQLAGTELVVLSACETGVGEIRVGEGVYGLRRAFQEAGAQSVLSTLWSISDDGTQHFMKRFYQRFIDGSPPQQALRDTQLEFIDSDNWSHPFFWAPFVMVGE